MLKKIHIDAQLTSSNDVISAADKIILPGVGAFDHCMTTFNASGLRDVVEKRVLQEKVPLLGICVGLQMLTKGSDEGKEPGLGWIQGKTIRFQQDRIGNLKIPHMGWTSVQSKKPSCLTKDFTADTRFYFVHSYHVQVDNPTDELLSAHYGYDFTAAVEKDNIRGVQFHPEKSHRFGMQLLENFAKHC